MNTKLFNSFAVAAMSVLALACAKEPVGGGIEAGVSFSVEVPGTPATKAIGDGETAKKLYYQVFDKDGAAIEGLGVQNTDIAGKTATVKFQLVKDQEYNFVFWAQTANDGYYTIDNAEGLKKITANYTGKNSNDENFDAFYAVKKMTVTGPVSETVKLSRPFAQINIATAGQISAGTTTKDIDFTGAASAVTVKGVPNVFSPLATTDVFTGNADVTFAKAEAPAGDITVNAKTYKYLAVNYVFAPVDGTVYDVNAILIVEGKDVRLTVPTVPAKQNWRTNIVGDLLTAGADFTVVVDPDFGGDQNVAYDETALRAAVLKGGTVVVSKNVTIKDKSLKPNGGTELNFIVSENATLTGELTGYESKLINLFNRNVQCTISGSGTIVGPKCDRDEYSSAVELEDNANTCVIDGNVTFKGADGTKSGKCDACVIIRAGKVTVNGGHFIASRDVDGGDNPAILLYSPNSYRSELIINGGTFESEVGNSKFLINIQDEYRDHASVKIYGGTFIGFDPADNEAEGAHTNFVATGYHSTKVSTDANGVSTYMVSKEGTIPVVNQEGFKDAVAQANATVVVPAGTYTAPSNVADGVTIEGVDGTTVDIPSAVAYHDKNITFKSLTVKSPNANYTGIQHAASVKYENCVIEGQPFSYAKTAVYEGCTFEQKSNAAYNIWTYGSADITFKDCIFNCAGKAVLIYNEGALTSGKVTFNGCEFHASESVAGKAAIEIDSSFTSYVVQITNCTQNGFSNGSVSGNPLWNKKKGDESVTIVVDGTQVL